MSKSELRGTSINHGKVSQIDCFLTTHDKVIPFFLFVTSLGSNLLSIIHLR
jgi:hypothetical protein